MSDTRVRDMHIETVPIDTVTPFPGNPRRGNRDTIRTSRDRYGQYKPILVQASTGHIIAGNNYHATAVDAGDSHIAIIRLDVDDDEARRINLIDNKTSDDATYDHTALTEFLEELPTLDGTGWTRNELDELQTSLSPLDVDPPPTTGDAPTDAITQAFGVYLPARDEAHQAVMLETLASQGYTVRAI